MAVRHYRSNLYNDNDIYLAVHRNILISIFNFQENELIKYYIDDDILTIEISQKPASQSNDRDSCLGESFG